MVSLVCGSLGGHKGGGFGELSNVVGYMGFSKVVRSS